jgi:glutamate dehydrogenase
MEFMEVLSEAAQSTGLPIEDLQKIANIIIWRGNFSVKHVERELHTFCCKIGMAPYYFRTTPPETIANHIESIMAAEIIAINRGSNQLEVDLISEREDSAMYIINAGHGKAVEMERRIEKLFPSFRLQSYRTRGIALQSPFRTYFVERPDHPEPNPGPGEDDIRKVGARQFLAMSTQSVIDRYQGVLSRSLASDGPYVEASDTKANETRIMISIPASGGYRFISGVSDIINHYGLFSLYKFLEPFSNGRLIHTVYVDRAAAAAHLADIIHDIGLIYINPENTLSPLIRNNTLSVHEAFYAISAMRFTHQFLSSFGPEYLALMMVLKDRPDLTDILKGLRTRLVKDSYTEERILQTVFHHSNKIKELYAHFACRFNPDGSGAAPECLPQLAEIPFEIDRGILEFFLLFNDAVLKTNFYKKAKSSLSFRLNPAAFLDAIAYEETPEGLFMMLGKEFYGFHVRFRDIARGGIRIVKSRDIENYEQNADFIFDENYHLALTQQRKNKDIPEGGAKGALLLNLESQEAGERAFEKYVDGLLDVILPDEEVKDHLGREEILFLGPDEGTAQVMDWAARRVQQRNYRFWKSFSTGKSSEEGGIPHDVHGMTTHSVHEYVLGILGKLGVDEKRVTKAQTGGPDGDLGSNEILVSRDQTVCIVDGSGVLYDPDDLNREELMTLASERKMGESFDRSKLSPGGFFLHVNDCNVTLPDGIEVKSGTEFRNNFHLNPMLKADLFVPCGGRPNSINIRNWKQLLDKDGTPRFRYIVEGANLFLTQEARLALEKVGVMVFKDASTNKGGVTSSSLEVLASLALTDEEYASRLVVKDGKVPAFREAYVRDVVKIIKENARLEFESLWNEHKLKGVPLSVLSDELSNKINKITDAISRSSLAEDQELSTRVLEKHCPPTLVDAVGVQEMFNRIPRNYTKAIVSSWLASHFIYTRGLEAGEVDFHEFLTEVRKG